MKIIHITRSLFVAILLFSGSALLAQGTTESKKTSPKKEVIMKTFLIERDIPGAGNLTPADLKGISQKSCSVLKNMGSGIQWIQSYVTGNKIFCVYKAENEDLIREHGKEGGFPVTNITEISSVISPETAK